MRLFLFIFLSIYGGMHAGVFWRFYTAFPSLGRWRWAGAPFMLLMVLSPIAARLLEHHDFTTLGKIASYVAFIWMAIVFWLFCYCFLMDMIALVLWGGRTLAPKWNVPSLAPKWRFVVPAGLMLVSLVWGMIEVRVLRRPQVVCNVPALPDGRRELKILMLTDVHLGSMVGREKLAQIAAVVDAEKPDIIVSTGDLADGGAEHLERLVEPLRNIDAPLGKYAVMGNHEFYTGVQRSVEFHENAGFRMLRGSAVTLGDNQELVIVGVDDPAGKRFNLEGGLDEAAALAAGRGDRAVVLLKHRPRVDPESVDKFDIQLSGHVHGGQIFPFNVFVAMDYKYGAGLHRVSDRSRLYVSRGTGTWGPKLRVLAPAEVTVIVLRRE